VGKYAIVPGPKDRLEVLIKKLENPVRNFSFMEYTMYTGTYQGIKVTAINGGRFSTDTSITTEVMCMPQIPNIIRIGTCGALSEEIKVGDLVVVDEVIRGDGVTPYYVDNDFKTVAIKKSALPSMKSLKAWVLVSIAVRSGLRMRFYARPEKS